MDKINLHAIFSAQWMFICIITVVGLSIIVTLIVKPEKYKYTRLNVFMSILEGSTIFLIGLSLGISALTLEEQKEVNYVEVMAKAVANMYSKPDELIARSTHAREKFVKSFYFNKINLYNLPEKKEAETRFSILEEQYIMSQLIQAWEDYLRYRHHLLSTDAPWFNVFIRWAQSPFLKDYFNLYKHIHEKQMILLAELLFEYAEKLPIPTPNPDDYVNVVSSMLQDKRFKDIIKISEENIFRRLIWR